MAEALFHGADLRVDLMAHGHGRLMVTFDWREPGREGFRDLALSQQFAKNGFDQVMIRSRVNDWFVNGDTGAVEAALAGAAARYDAVHMLGYSMGGYGALRFAAAARAVHLVAVSPQVTIAPAHVPWDGRYRAEAEAYGFDADLGDLGPRAVPGLGGAVILDPFRRLDLRHGRAIAALFPGLAVVRLGFGGHPATRALRQAGRGFVAQRAAMGTVPVRQVGRVHRQVRRKSPAYWEALAARAALAAQDPQGGARRARQARRAAIAEYALDQAEKTAPAA